MILPCGALDTCRSHSVEPSNCRGSRLTLPEGSNVATFSGAPLPMERRCRSCMRRVDVYANRMGACCGRGVPSPLSASQDSNLRLCGPPFGATALPVELDAITRFAGSASPLVAGEANSQGGRGHCWGTVAVRVGLSAPSPERWRCDLAGIHVSVPKLMTECARICRLIAYTPRRFGCQPPLAGIRLSVFVCVPDSNWALVRFPMLESLGGDLHTHHAPLSSCVSGGQLFRTPGI